VAIQAERQLARLVARDVSRALIPDDHRARAACLSLVNALEVARRQGMVLDGNGQPPDTSTIGPRLSFCRSFVWQLPACSRPE
jgi:hypothetical protein